MKALAIALIAITLGGSSLGAFGMDVRPATEEEITAALQGCWDREMTFRERSYDRRRPKSDLQYQVTACFESGGVVHTSWVGGFEAFETAGAYSVSKGKLQLRGPDGGSDGWTFRANDLDCDLVMSPGRAMRLMNCVGVGADAGLTMADSSFSLETVQ